MPNVILLASRGTQTTLLVIALDTVLSVSGQDDGPEIVVPASSFMVVTLPPLETELPSTMCVPGRTVLALVPTETESQKFLVRGTRGKIS